MSGVSGRGWEGNLTDQHQILFKIKRVDVITQVVKGYIRTDQKFVSWGEITTGSGEEIQINLMRNKTVTFF